MVNWDRVEELRSKGWDWDRIADDPKVGFHPDASVQEPGRALRGLYHRQRSRRERRTEATTAATPRLTKAEREKAERKWTLPRIGYLLVPVFAIWFAVAYLVPSPFGLVLKALPYLALCLVVVAFLLIFGLFRSTGARWSKVFQSTVILGVILGLVIVGLIGLTGYALGCPYLPPSGTAQPEGWMSVNVAPWQDSGRPVLYFYGATWCPYCSASSWAIWKALSEFGSVSGISTGYSAEDSIPYVNLASAQVSSSSIAFSVNEDTSGVTDTFPSTSNCVQQAYVTAYSNGIPFVVINGQYVHAGSLIQPGDVSSYSTAELQQQVAAENGSAWSVVQGQTWWMMTFLAKSAGATPTNLAQQPYYSSWSSATKSAVASDLAQVG